MSLTPQDVANFLQGNLKHLSSQYFDLPLHEVQQVALRAYLCKPCLDNGKCLICNCKTPEMFYAPNKVDKDGKFDTFLSKGQWEALVNNINEYRNFINMIDVHPRFHEFFKFTEFDSPDEKDSGEKYMQKEFLRVLTEVRIAADIPFKINSGYRTIKHNKKVGGSKDSAHTNGYAVDIVANTSATRFKIVQAALATGITRIGIGKTYVHLDTDPTLPQGVMWDYYDK